jgi:hypothetical protein
MSTRKKEMLVKFILWKEILAIPTYTILFNYYIKLFWILLIIGRITNLIILSNNIYIDTLLDDCISQYDKTSSKLASLAKLSLFAVISTPIIYILILINHHKLFVILITIEISDYIVYKLLDENLSKNIKSYFKEKRTSKIKSRK